MDEKEEFCKEIMGIIGPWEIDRIRTDQEHKRVDVYLEYQEIGRGKCPICGKQAAIYDRRENRVWRHLDSCEYQTYIHCRIPRTKCDNDGIKTMDIPWAMEQSHYTLAFERYAIDALKLGKNRSETARLLGISWDEINGIMGRAVKRGLEARKATVITHLGIDEKSFLRGQKYATVLTDTDGKRVLEVVQNRDTEAVNAVFGALKGEQKEKVKAIRRTFSPVDFWKAYINGAEKHIPQAKIVHDKFHIMKYMNEAVNKVRAGEHKWRLKQKDSTLTGTKYLWLKKLENFTDKDKKRWQELKLDQLDVGRAWNLKELLGELWKSPSITNARKLFKAWYNAATHSKLEPVISVAKTIHNHFENIITWWRHRISNSFAEGINSVIQEIKTVARGFRNFENYRTAILFYCGKLALYPQKSQ